MIKIATHASAFIAATYSSALFLAWRGELSLLNLGQLAAIIACTAALTIVALAHRRQTISYGIAVSAWLLNVITWQCVGFFGRLFELLDTPSVLISSWGIGIILHAAFSIFALTWYRIHATIITK
jgi:hypothetical protein